MGAKFIDLTEKRFGKLTVIKRINSDKWGKALWLCKCECGNTTIKNSYYLKYKQKCSCGCINKEKTGVNNPCYRHGLSNTKEYKRLSSILGSMKCRCYNKNNKQYNNYGGRGIKICDEWLAKKGKGLLNFYNWAISTGYNLGLTIDRINNDGNYQPDNCRWVTNKEQSNNKRNNHLITYHGETHTMMEWSKILNVNYNTLRGRINNYKWDVNKAFETPFKK